MDNFKELRRLTREEFYHKKKTDPFFNNMLSSKNGDLFGHYVPYLNKETEIIGWYWANDTVSKHSLPEDEYEMIYG